VSYDATDTADDEDAGASFWSSPTGVASIAAVLAAALAGVAAVVMLSGDDPQAAVPPVPGEVSVGAPAGPATATEDPVGGVLVWTEQVMLDRDGLELDENSPRRGTRNRDEGDIFTGNWTQISARAGARVSPWNKAETPTAAGCLVELASSGGDSAPAETGRLYCVESSDGRPAMVKLVNKSPFGAFGWITQATVWQRPE
jgi:hypothetical protein